MRQFFQTAGVVDYHVRASVVALQRFEEMVKLTQKQYFGLEIVEARGEFVRLKFFSLQFVVQSEVTFDPSDVSAQLVAYRLETDPLIFQDNRLKKTPLGVVMCLQGNLSMEGASDCGGEFFQALVKKLGEIRATISPA